LAFETVALVLVDTQAAGGFRVVGQQFLSELGQQLLCRSVGVGGCAHWQVGQDERGTSACNEIAAIRGHRKAPAAREKKRSQHNTWALQGLSEGRCGFTSAMAARTLQRQDETTRTPYTTVETE